MVMNNEPAARSPIRFGDNLRITVAANQGGRRYMEDRCVVHTERTDSGDLAWTFVGVFDGHGGEHASEYVRRHLLMNITKNVKFNSEHDEDILEAIRQGFLMTHEQMRHVYEEWPYTASGYPSTAGTTVSCVFIRNGKLYTGHVGDSAIYLGTVENGELHSRPLTIDHKPEAPLEQLRIAKAGGETAVKSGVTRVVWKREARVNLLTRNRQNPPVMDSIPFLSVARSLGDLWSYNEQTNMFVVSPEPDLGVHTLTGNDFCLVLASDGMTNVLTGDQAISIVFREEELVEINEEINRNHARCVLRTTLQKWRTLRADNVTVASVIFDIDPLRYTKEELLMNVGQFVNVSQVLTDVPDAMLKIGRTDNVLLRTQRVPILYNGSRDENFCRVQYRGPGFRTHEDELLDERRTLMAKFGNPISIAPGTADSKRGPPLVEKKKTNGNSIGKEANDETYDDDDEDDEEEEEEFDPSEEINLNFSVTETDIVTVLKSSIRPSSRPVFSDEYLENGKDEEDDASHLQLPSIRAVRNQMENGKDEDDTNHQSTSSAPSITPSRSPPGHTVRRVKAEAIRRVRTPRIGGGDQDDLTETLLHMLSPGSLVPLDQPPPGCTPDRRVTRSSSRAAITTSPVKNHPRSPGASVIGINYNLGPDARLGPPITPSPRRSTRLQSSNGVEPSTPNSAKLTQSRKRPRTMEIAMSGVTPVVAGLSLQDRLALPPPRLPLIPPPAVPPTPSRSAPSSPKKPAAAGLKTSKWSLSKLDETKKKKDGIVRVSEVADEEDDVANGSDDVMREPPSKMRRFYGYMKKMIWGK
ncbi:hypothetical protein CAEBREN_26297 [Caenorhabditis brenneri]|uniref:PPM-type phosphatase domain-containing protein n=1 Tax=Caenorhabditis brenneri TaxID=135651 RepID=G0P4A6_CAEBE|nr:hypothetical protein CAEBREN_26297 [Caenorhabditis brenneri]